MKMEQTAILKLDNVGYTYDGRVKVLDGLSLEFFPGQIVGITGRSGAGKSTLLSLLSGLTKPTSGKIFYQGRDIADMNRFDYRARHIGVVFQGYNLLPALTGVENVIMSLELSGQKVADKRNKALDLLEQMGVDEYTANRRVLKLSGGEQQRVAIARALCYEPGIILADEPTGNLDVDTQEQVVELLRDLAHKNGKCVIVVTHSPQVSKMMDAVIPLAPLTKKKA